MSDFPSLPPSAFNLPPGVSLRDVDPPETCPVCGRLSEDGDLCPRCQRERDEDEREPS